MKRIISQYVSNLFALFLSVDRPKPGHRILMYHSIGGQALDDEKGIFSLSPNQFKGQVEYLAQYSKIKIFPLEEALKDSTPCRLSLSFDDGYKDNLLVAAPLLVEHKIPFTVFVSIGFVEKQDKNFLTASQIKELAGLPGVSIGAHGVSHKRLTQCSEDELKYELEYSRKYLEDLLGKSITTMAYPYGDFDERVVDRVKKCGYKLAVSSRIGINSFNCDPLILKRTEIRGDDNFKEFKQKLVGAWDWCSFKSSL